MKILILTILCLTIFITACSQKNIVLKNSYQPQVFSLHKSQQNVQLHRRSNMRSPYHISYIQNHPNMQFMHHQLQRNVPIPVPYPISTFQFPRSSKIIPQCKQNYRSQSNVKTIRKQLRLNLPDLFLFRTTVSNASSPSFNESTTIWTVPSSLITNLSTVSRTNDTPIDKKEEVIKMENIINSKVEETTITDIVEEKFETTSESKGLLNIINGFIPRINIYIPHFTRNSNIVTKAPDIEAENFIEITSYEITSSTITP